MVPETKRNRPGHGRQGPKHSEHPGCTERQVGDKWETGQRIQSVVGDKCEIMWTKALKAECIGRQAWETDRCETSAKSRGPKHSECIGRQMETSGRQAWNHAGQRIESVVGDKREITRNKSLRASRVYTGRQVGDKPDITWTENPGCSGRQVRNHEGQSAQSELLGDKWETNAKSREPKHSETPECLLQESKPGDKRQITRPEHAPLSKV